MITRNARSFQSAARMYRRLVRITSRREDVREGNWRRRADSNRRIEVLQTSALTTWLRRPVLFAPAYCWPVRIYDNSPSVGLVPRAGLEPTRAKAHGPLKTACLPFPPPRLGLAKYSIARQHAVKRRTLFYPPASARHLANEDHPNLYKFALHLYLDPPGAKSYRQSRDRQAERNRSSRLSLRP